METPRLNGYPMDQRVLAELRAERRAREVARLARRTTPTRPNGFRAFLDWLSA